MVKSDIRRSYASMLTNVLNTLDFPMLFEYFTTFCTRGITHTQVFGENRECNMPPIFKLVGLQSVAQFWFNKSAAMPDCVFELLGDTKVHSYSHTGSTKIVSKLVMRATKLFDVPFAWVLPQQSHSEQVRISAMTGSSAADYSLCRHSAAQPFKMQNGLAMIDTSITSLLASAPLLANPQSFECNVQLTMHLNGDKLIEGMEFDPIPAAAQ